MEKQETTKYAVCEINGPIWSIGDTEQEAIDNYTKNTGDSDTGIQKWAYRFNIPIEEKKPLVLCKITDRLAEFVTLGDAVKEYSANNYPTYEISNGIADIPGGKYCPKLTIEIHKRGKKPSGTKYVEFYICADKQPIGVVEILCLNQRDWVSSIEAWETYRLRNDMPGE